MILISLLSSSGTARMIAQYYPNNTDVLLFMVFTLSAVLHLPFSLGFHLFMPINQRMFNLWRRLDVCAIFMVAVLLTFALDYFVLPWWGTVINTAAAAAVATRACTVFWRMPDEKELDHAKHARFVGMIVVCYLVPCMVGLVRDSIHLQVTWTSVCASGVMGSLALGAYAFATEWPQRLHPGAFNYVGHSHQVMHLGVMSAHLFEFFFIYDNFTRYTSLRVYTSHG